VGAEGDTSLVGASVTGTPWYGGFAEQVVLPAASVFRLPAFIDSVTAVASTVTFGTAYHALTDRGGLIAGESLLVTGATGGVGSAAVQLGKLLGAHVIAAVGSSAKATAARHAGADEVVVYDDAGPSLRDQIKAATDGRGVDVVLDPVGGDVFDQCVRSMAANGRLLVIGFTAGRIPHLPTNLVLLKETSVAGVFWGAFREREPDRAAAQLDQVWGWIDAGDLALPPVGSFSLESARTALEQLAARVVVGKAVLTMADPVAPR
jgi:NADPH2:quinone reductase